MTNGSNEVSATVSEQVKALNVSFESSAEGITLNWTKDAAMDYYEVYRATNGGTYRLMKRTTATTVASTGLKAGKTYSYKVRAYKEVDGKKIYGAWSKAVTYEADYQDTGRRVNSDLTGNKSISQKGYILAGIGVLLLVLIVLGVLIVKKYLNRRNKNEVQS